MIDHFVVAGTSLSDLVDWFTRTTGVTPSPGGSHPGVGTRNALASLGGATYLELIAPDPEQGEPERARPFGIDGLEPGERRLTTFAVAVDDIEGAVARLAAIPADLGSPVAMSRTRPDGVLLAWKLTHSRYPEGGGAVPFLIEWGDTPHPAATAAPGCTVEQITVRHPDPDWLARVFEAIGGNVPIESGEPGLRLTLATPNGTVELA